MAQYIALIHGNAGSVSSPAEWEHFFAIANASGMFQGGSEISLCCTLGRKTEMKSAGQLAGYMRFDSDDLSDLGQLLECHPVIKNGGTIELCEMTVS